MSTFWSNPWTWGSAAALLGGGIGTAVALLSGRRSANTVDFGRVDGESEDNDAPADAVGRDLIPTLCQRAGLPEDVATFLNFVARGESGWKPNFVRGDPRLAPEGTRVNEDMRDANAARSAYERLQATFDGCGHPPEHYQFGSGGLFGAIPSYWLHHLRDTPLRCASPFEVFDPAFSITGAYSFARGVSQHPKFEGTVQSLRAGWGSLRRMIDRTYDGKLAKWRRHAADSGQSAMYIGLSAPEFPKLDLLDLYHRLGGELALPGSEALA